MQSVSESVSLMLEHAVHRECEVTNLVECGMCTSVVRDLNTNRINLSCANRAP